MTEVKVGDRVKVTKTITDVREGEVTRLGAYGIIDIDGRSTRTKASASRDETITVEIIEPEYELDAYYIDADGDVFQRVAHVGWRTPQPGAEYHDFDYPTRPLRKLVPEG